MNGIYCYHDLNDGEIVYVGKDSHIEENRRHKQHMMPSHYNNQPFNRILQNNLERYSYSVLVKGDFSNNIINALEMLFIRIHNPKFNFTLGGDGVYGYKPSKETIEKMSGENHPLYGKPRPKEVRERISKSHEGKTVSKECQLKMSKSQNNTGYYRVSKVYHKMYRQGFTWRYKYYDENGNRKVISCVDIDKLEEKVKSKGLDWIILENNKSKVLI